MAPIPSLWPISTKPHGLPFCGSPTFKATLEIHAPSIQLSPSQTLGEARESPRAGPSRRQSGGSTGTAVPDQYQVGVSATLCPGGTGPASSVPLTAPCSPLPHWRQPLVHTPGSISWAWLSFARCLEGRGGRNRLSLWPSSLIMSIPSPITSLISCPHPAPPIPQDTPQVDPLSSPPCHALTSCVTRGHAPLPLEASSGCLEWILKVHPRWCSDWMSPRCGWWIAILFFCLYILAELHSLWDLSSPTRDWTWDYGSESTSSNHWTTRELPVNCYFNKLILLEWSKS